MTLVNGSGWTNVGDDVLAFAISTALRTIDPEAQITVAGGPFAPRLLREGPVSAFIPLGSGRASDRLRFVSALARSAQVIVGGGGLLNDRLPRFYRPFTRTVRLAHALRRPVLLYGVGVHPPRTERFERELRALGRSAVSITVRDELSREILGAYGVDAEVVLDPAFAIDWPVIATPDGALRSAGRRLVVNLRPWWHLSEIPGRDPARHAELVESVAAAIEWFGPDEVTLLGLSSYGDDDRVPLAALGQRLAGLCPVSLRTPATVLELAETYAFAAGSIVMRLHAAIFGVVSHTPTVAIAYDGKVPAVLAPVSPSMAVIDIDALRPEDLHQALRVVTSHPPPDVEALSRAAAGQLAHHLRACAT